MSGMMSRFEGVYALSLGADGEVIEGPEALPGAKHSLEATTRFPSAGALST
jgi:hypothetical protein